MVWENNKINNLLNSPSFYKTNNFLLDSSIFNSITNSISLYKKGNKIKIKKLNKGKFTEYCGGNVTSKCIQKGKNSPDPKIRKRATFAANARSWKHLNGGIFMPINRYNTHNLFTNKNNEVQ